ncbi:MAG: 1-deoxy-D-xylulose-5-phosphate synthase [Lachnospiraceae bacterium]|nr:1-deoxy-D-xylulose-5-phosphate synthase [Lachnospiraceae bacterium]
MRRFLVQNISRTGGHLSSNLGVVELTMALHLCVDLPKDKIIWDVGHQSYTHKLLTGRKDGFRTLRQYGGMSGFPRHIESDCDVVDTGHSSTSIGIALGLAKARDLKKEDNTIIAVIGDGALSGGLAYEALNNAARLKSNLIIVLNDNQMSISKNVGGMSRYLGEIRTNTNYTGLKEEVEKMLQKMPRIGNVLADQIRSAKDVFKRILIPGMLFEDMGLTYIGPINGHDIRQMTKVFQSAKKMNKAVLVHVVTQKGKGYLPAWKDPAAFHGVAPFYIRDGKPKRIENSGPSYTQIFSDTIIEAAGEDEKITAISAAMPTGTGLADFAKKYPERFFDVGIAEEYAVTFAAGQAAGGLHPVVAIYSTFLQRAYDQILHDVCMNRLPVTFVIDRAGLVGSDGKTHQGIFDLSFLLQIPDIVVMAPKNAWELKKMLRFSFSLDLPAAVRYPRGEAFTGLPEFRQQIEPGKAEWLKKGKKVAFLALGSMVETAMEVSKLLEKRKIQASVVNMRFAKPLDFKALEELKKSHSLIVPMEEGVISCGFGQMVAAWYQGARHITVLPVALPDRFIEHGSVRQLKEKYRLDAESIEKRVLSALHNSNG